MNPQIVSEKSRMDGFCGFHASTFVSVRKMNVVTKNKIMNTFLWCVRSFREAVHGYNKG